MRAGAKGEHSRRQAHAVVYLVLTKSQPKGLVFRTLGLQVAARVRGLGKVLQCFTVSTLNNETKQQPHNKTEQLEVSNPGEMNTCELSFFFSCLGFEDPT